jgi:hypothetical protein
MACPLTKGRIEPCKDSVGGLKAAYFSTAFGDLNASTIETADDSIENFDSTTATVFRYDLRGTSSFEGAITSSRENGTSVFDQTLNLSLKKLSAADNKEIKLMAYGRPQIIVEDHNGNFFLVGREFGAELTGGSMVSGAGMGDLSGYTLTFAAQEKTLANFINVDSVSDTQIQVGTTTITVTGGTDF